MKKRALISVSDKNGIIEFTKKLVDFGYEIISTGGTAKALSEAGIKNISISDITGFPECLDGRVKTLHPNVHAGLLAVRANKDHMEQLTKLNINTIDIVVVNLYPFKQTVMKPDVEFQDAVENIDIGGPTMLRSAAKNFQDVVAAVDPNDYGKIIKELEDGGVTMATKKYLMYKVFQHTAVYDTLISAYLRKQIGIEYPEQITYAYEKTQDMRYGENPHQTAVFYKEIIPVKDSLAEAKQLHGKELSFNNINDTNGAVELLREFDGPAAVAVKHTNPCGVAEADTLEEAMQCAFDCDPVSIFGGIIALNRKVDLKTAEIINKIFIEIVIAPDYEPDAFKLLSSKPSIRILKSDGLEKKAVPSYEFKKVSGGLLVQSSNDLCVDKYELKTKRAPSDKETEDMLFAMKVVKHTKSNAIVIAKNKCAVGIGAGQTNRIWATEQAIEHAGGRVKGAVMASDAFFPFADCVEAAAKAGITAIIQPGGSVRDSESVEACDKNNMTIIFTGIRHFKH